MPTHKEIADLAHAIWLSNGSPDGTAQQDWALAEQRLSAAHPVSEVEEPTYRIHLNTESDQEVESMFTHHQPIHRAAAPVGNELSHGYTD